MKEGPWRIIFFGTPGFAVPTLKALLDAGENVLAAVSQPDRPQGRGLKAGPTPVKESALAREVPVFQPVRLKDPEFVQRLKDWSPELLIVAAYGRLLTPEILALPKVGCLNVHASLLPRHRGAAPINWALIRGDAETGVTIMWMAEELDAGDVFLQERLTIRPEDNAGTLAAALAELGAALMMEALTRLRRGEMIRQPQPQEGVTLAPPLTPEMRLLHWELAAPAVAGVIRGLDPRPGAYTFWGKERLGVFGGRLKEMEGKPGPPGAVLGLTPQGLEIACGTGSVTAAALQLAGKKRLPAADFLRGHPRLAQARLGTDA